MKRKFMYYNNNKTSDESNRFDRSDRILIDKDWFDAKWADAHYFKRDWFDKKWVHRYKFDRK